MSSILKPILVIDDEPDIRNMVKIFLEEDGYEAVTAEDGIKGMELFREIQPEIVITDIKMPVMLGTEVLAKVKGLRPETEVIVITGHGEVKLAIQALQNDASDFIQKPFGYDVLSLAVKRAYEKIKVRETLAQAQVQLLQSEKMASLGQLAAGIAHEVNNPVGFVTSNLGTLKKYAHRLKKAYEEIVEVITNDENQNIAGKIKKILNKNQIDFILKDVFSIIDESLEGTKRVKHIVTDLKDFSHIDIKKMVSYNINDCINSTLNIVWNEIKYKAEVRKNLGNIPQIICFPQQINQVIMNLIINSVQAIEKDGIIEITTKAVKEGVKLIIKDNGSGIPQELIRKIFDPFFTTKDVGQGTGLGLHIVYSIVKRHGGDIEVQSEAGKGTQFTVFLPFEPPQKVKPDFQNLAIKIIDEK